MLVACVRLEPSMGIHIYDMPVFASDILQSMASLRLRWTDASAHLCLSGGLTMSMPCNGVPCSRRPPHGKRSPVHALGVLCGTPL